MDCSPCIGGCVCSQRNSCLVRSFITGGVGLAMLNKKEKRLIDFLAALSIISEDTTAEKLLNVIDSLEHKSKIASLHFLLCRNKLIRENTHNQANSADS